MIWGVVLAAGLGRRIGTSKALLTLGGDTFHQRALGALRGAGLELLVVINPWLEGALPLSIPGERRVMNRDPDQEGGMFASVQLGLTEALRVGATGVILLPVDYPLVTGADVRSVAAHLREGASIVVATHGGRRGHPIGVNREVAIEITRETSLTTLRDIVHRDPERVVEVAASPGALLGVNTKEDLERVSALSFR